MARQVSLLVNNAPIPIDYFVAGFIEHTVAGIMASLEGTGEIKTLDLTVEADKVTINLNDAPVSINVFVTRIIRNTITGMVSSLKGVSEINQMKIAVKG
ncbi:hypothetical protein ACFLVN_00850 [Chloroflexota bacterium]